MAGKFHAGRLMSEAESSAQIELDSGKRVKVKAANVLLRFDKPMPAELFSAAQAIAQDIDLDLAWEFAPEGDFGFADLARDYFDAKAGVEKQAAALFALFDAPHYFRRQGKGQFRKAPEETVKAALLGIARKQAIAAQIDAWAGELVSGACPVPVRELLYKILFKPDKNGPEYKAVVEASRRSQKAPLELLKAAGAIALALSVPLEALPVRKLPERHRASKPGRAADPRNLADRRGAGVFDRRFGHHRNR